MAEALRRLVRDARARRPRRPHPALRRRADRRRSTRSSGSAPPAPPATAPICCACSGPRIETIEPGFGIEQMRLVAGRVEPLGAQPIAGALAGDKPRRRSGAADRPPRRPARRAAPLPAERGRKRRARAQRPPPRPARPAGDMAGLAAPGPPAVAARADRQCPGPASRPAAAPLHAGAAGTIASARPTGPSASMANGGSEAPRPRRCAIISRSRTRPATASGCSAAATA